MPILTYRHYTPQIAKRAFIAPSATVIGKVTIGEESGIWFGCTVRGDVEHITIGKRTNIQDGTVIHVSRHDGPTVIGDDITVGHLALLHACTLQDACFIGMGAIVMDAAVIETGAMVAAGAMVTPGKVVPAGELWAGRPAKFFRKLSEAEQKEIFLSRDNYMELAREYLTNNVRQSVVS